VYKGFLCVTVESLCRHLRDEELMYLRSGLKSTGHRKGEKRGTLSSYHVDHEADHTRDSLGRGERLRERDHPKCDRLGGDWVTMGSQGRSGGDVPEGEAGHHVAAAGAKISRGQTGTDGRYWALAAAAKLG
jgi:hypothetical protein